MNLFSMVELQEVTPQLFAEQRLSRTVLLRKNSQPSPLVGKPWSTSTFQTPAKKEPLFLRGVNPKTFAAERAKNLPSFMKVYFNGDKQWRARI
jgi:hypothetical protein